MGQIARAAQDHISKSKWTAYLMYDRTENDIFLFLRLNPPIQYFEIWLRKILYEANGQNRHTREKLMNVRTEREHFILPK